MILIFVAAVFAINCIWFDSDYYLVLFSIDRVLHFAVYWWRFGFLFIVCKCFFAWIQLIWQVVDANAFSRWMNARWICIETDSQCVWLSVVFWLAVWMCDVRACVIVCMWYRGEGSVGSVKSTCVVIVNVQNERKINSSDGWNVWIWGKHRYRNNWFVTYLTILFTRTEISKSLWSPVIASWFRLSFAKATVKETYSFGGLCPFVHIYYDVWNCIYNTKTHKYICFDPGRKRRPAIMDNCEKVMLYILYESIVTL